jgi:hypothetical protein
MKSADSAVHALRAIARFEIAMSGAEVARAAARSRHEQQQVEQSGRHYEAIAHELRRAMRRASVIDPIHLNAMQRLLFSQRELLAEERTRLDRADRHERQLREVLGSLRSRETALDAVIDRQQKQAQRQLHEAQARTADDLWLQQVRRRSR